MTRAPRAGQPAQTPHDFELLQPGAWPRMAYRLGRQRATGVVTVERPGRRREVLVLRRGHLMTAEGDGLGRRAARRLSMLAGEAIRVHFEGGVAAYPPGAVHRQLALSTWAREHLERQVDAGRARDLAAELAGVRLSLRHDLAPDPATRDATDRRIFEALAVPRRLEQLWSAARTPRFRLLSTLYFLREVGALRTHGVVAQAPRPAGAGAHRLLGLSPSADAAAVKRAYRRLARALHPDLHPEVSDERRRQLARQLAAVTDAYRELSGSC